MNPLHVLILLQLTTATNTLATERICNEDNDCYPLVFEPQAHWKVIREGQRIPVGLDVRIDMETGYKMGRLSEEQDNLYGREVIAYESMEDGHEGFEEEGIDVDGDIVGLKRAVAEYDTMDLNKAIDALEQGNITPEVLNSLDDHSHSLEGGVTISSHISELLTTMPTSNKELILRIIAQCFRHNEDALANADTMVIKTLLDDIPVESSLIKRRIVGVLSALLHCNDKIEAFRQYNGESILRGIYDTLDSSTRVRLIQMLEKIGYTQDLYSQVQQSLRTNGMDEDVFDQLIHMKESNQSLKTSEEFINWLVDQIASAEGEWRTRLTEARHVTFGNPMGLRKALTDEL